MQIEVRHSHSIASIVVEVWYIQGTEDVAGTVYTVYTPSTYLLPSSRLTSLPKYRTRGGRNLSSSLRTFLANHKVAILEIPDRTQIALNSNINNFIQTRSCKNKSACFTYFL